MKIIRLFLWILIFGGGFSLNFTVEAQDRDTVQTFLELPQIIIESESESGYESSRGYSVFRSKMTRIDRTLASTTGLSSLLNRVPGIQFSDRGTLAVGDQVTIRGAGWRSQFGIRGIHLIEDGHSITSPDGQTNSEGFNAFFVQSLEVFRGPAALMWGNGGGGVIHLTTFSSTEPEGLSIRTLFGSHATKRIDASLVQQIRSGKRKIQFASGSTEGYRQHSSSQTVYLGAQKIQLLSPDWIRRHKIRYAALLNSQNPGTLDRSSFEANPFNSRAFFENSQAGKTTHDLLITESLIRSNQEVEVRIQSNIGLRSVENPLPFGYIDLRRTSGSAQALFIGNQASSVDWTIGVEGAFQSDNRKESENQFGSRGDQFLLHQDEFLVTLSSFAKIGKRIDRLSMEAGIRVDRTDIRVEDLLESSVGTESDFEVNDKISRKSLITWLPAISMNYQAAKLNLYANLQSSFENPTLSELSNLPEGGTGLNPSLNPEKTLAIEAGIRSNTNIFSFDLTFYQHHVQDLLLPFQVNPDGEFYFSNEGKAHIQGVELWALLETKPHSLLSFNQEIAITLTEAKFNKGVYHQNHVPGVTPLQLFTRSELIFERLLLELSTQLRNRTYVNNVNSESRDPFLKMDIKITTPYTTRFQPFLQWINITNELYSESISVNAAANRVFAPSLPRSLYVGLLMNL